MSTTLRPTPTLSTSLQLPTSNVNASLQLCSSNFTSRSVVASDSSPTAHDNPSEGDDGEEKGIENEEEGDGLASSSISDEGTNAADREASPPSSPSLQKGDLPGSETLETFETTGGTTVGSGSSRGLLGEAWGGDFEEVKGKGEGMQWEDPLSQRKGFEVLEKAFGKKMAGLELDAKRLQILKKTRKEVKYLALFADILGACVYFLPGAEEFSFLLSWSLQLCVFCSLYATTTTKLS